MLTFFDNKVGTQFLSALQHMQNTPAEETDAETSAFGEMRVIITRDEESRDRLQHLVSDFALVLTILQSKGMEFDDVILFDFFSSSPFESGFTILDSILQNTTKGKYHLVIISLEGFALTV